MTERGERKPTQEVEGRSLWRMTEATFKVAPSSQIRATIDEAIQRSRQIGRHDFVEKGALISFEFNGVNVSVKEDSDPNLIYRDWSRAMNGYITEVVGPYPAQELTEEDKANDARIEAENEARRRKEEAQYEAKEKVDDSFALSRRETELHERLNGVPLSEFTVGELFTILRTTEIWGGIRDDNVRGRDVAHLEGRLAEIEANQGATR